MPFTHVQGGGVSAGTISTQFNATTMFASTPTPGNLLVVYVSGILANSSVALTVTDAASSGNVFSTNSGLHFNNGSLKGVGFWWRIAPASPTTDITVAVSGGNFFQSTIFAEEFSFSGGSVVFDTEVYDNTQGTSNATISTPTINPTVGDLLIGAAIPGAANMTAPTAGATLGSWTGGAKGIVNSRIVEYDLSATSSVSAQYTMNVSNTWNSGIVAFSLSAGAAADTISTVGQWNLVM
jgi:hypothetical protein